VAPAIVRGASRELLARATEQRIKSRKRAKGGLATAGIPAGEDVYS